LACLDYAAERADSYAAGGRENIVRLLNDITQGAIKDARAAFVNEMAKVA
jgi:hypothetical protein